MTLIELLTNPILSGMDAGPKRRYMYSSASGESDVMGDLVYLIAAGYSGAGAGGVFGYQEVKKPDEIRAGWMSVFVSCRAIVAGSLAAYWNARAIIPQRTLITGALSSYVDARTTVGARSVTIGKATTVIDYELARQEDELFLLIA